MFESIQSFSLFILLFVYCFDNSLLLPLVDVLILMDPNGRPLQVINTSKETTTAYDKAMIPCRHPARTPMAWQSTCLPAREPFFADKNPFRPRSATAQGTRPGTNLMGLNPTEYEEVEYIELILEALQERKSRPGPISLTSGKLSYTYIWKIKYCLLKYILCRSRFVLLSNFSD